MTSGENLDTAEIPKVNIKLRVWTVVSVDYGSVMYNIFCYKS